MNISNWTDEDTETVEESFKWNKLNREEIWNTQYYDPTGHTCFRETAKEHFKVIDERERRVLEKLKK